MTRENLFRSSFESQFATFSGWNPIYTTSGLAPSDFPAFQLVLGETVYTSRDSTGRPVTGVQRFTLRLFFTHAQLAIATMLSTRSDLVALVESFFAGVYVVPSVSIGDTVRIDGVAIERVDPPAIERSDTRTTIGVSASYFFTIF